MRHVVRMPFLCGLVVLVSLVGLAAAQEPGADEMVPAEGTYAAPEETYSGTVPEAAGSDATLPPGEAGGFSGDAAGSSAGEPLPKTASPLAVYALSGLLSLAGALGVRRLRRSART